MRHTPDEGDDELAYLNAEPWMLDLLRLNPNYCSWGPSEDYMISDSQWGSAITRATWSDFSPAFGLDDLNEAVNFYFVVDRASKKCPTCMGSGMNPRTALINETFRDDCGGWHNKITQDEVDALVQHGRLVGDFDEPITAEAVNRAQGGSIFRTHDSLNRYILVETRAKRLGVWGHCDGCENGDGYVFTEPAAHAGLVLWWLHPRKGCSRGIRIERIEETEVPVVLAFLVNAADRNEGRFAKVRRASAAGQESF